MYCHIYRNGPTFNWHLRGVGGASKCGVLMRDVTESRILGDNGRDRPLPDPPDKELCPGCFPRKETEGSASPIKEIVISSIYESQSCVVALAEVQHCEKLRCGPYPPRTTEPEPNGLQVITSKTRYDLEADIWANPLYIPESEAAAFLQAWRNYRACVEGGARN